MRGTLSMSVCQHRAHQAAQCAQIQQCRLHTAICMLAPADVAWAYVAVHQKTQLACQLWWQPEHIQQRAVTRLGHAI